MKSTYVHVHVCVYEFRYDVTIFTTAGEELIQWQQHVKVKPLIKVMARE